MYTIYKITNLANGMMYIGQTRQKLYMRFSQHIYNAGNSEFRRCTLVTEAIKEYGRDKFTITPIDHAHTREEADNKEVFWIEHYKSTKDEFGYNILEGGHKAESINKKRVVCLETKEVFESVTDVAENVLPTLAIT